MKAESPPEIDVQDLSSNWKKLQQNLKVADNPRKRKAADGSLQLHIYGAKRQKPQVKQQPSSNPSKGSISQAKKVGNKSSRPQAGSAPSASLALWAADNNISTKDLAAAYGTSLHSTSIPPTQLKEESINSGLSLNAEAGKYVALDCEMVGVGPNPDKESALARVSIVNYHGHQLYDSFVFPKETVTDYRSHVSGITPKLLQHARTLEEVQKDVAGCIDGKILVGHALRKDLEALMLGHPKRDQRDTSKHRAYRDLAGGKTPGLKRLAREVLGVEIQGGEHSSIEDARATMDLFRKGKAEFEKDHVRKWGTDWKIEKRDGETGKEKSREKKKQQKKRRGK